MRARRVGEVCRLGHRHGVENAGGPACPRLATELGRRCDRGLLRRVDEHDTGSANLSMRLPSDSPRKKVCRRPVTVESAEVGEAKELPPFDEERAFFGKECLERSEIDDGWIYLDLTEIRVHRCAHRHAAREPIFQVDTGGSEVILPVTKGISGRNLEIFRAGAYVWSQLQAARRRKLAQSDEVPVPRHATNFLFWREREEILLLLVPPVSLELDSPHSISAIVGQL